jgi:hypothetical protein
MSIDIESGMRPTGSPNECTLTVQVRGATDVFRFAVNMLDDQVEICQLGRIALVELSEAMGADKFDTMARSILGNPRYLRLRDGGFFTRDQHCAACDTVIDDPADRTPVRRAQVLCKDCARHFGGASDA